MSSSIPYPISSRPRSRLWYTAGSLGPTSAATPGWRACRHWSQLSRLSAQALAAKLRSAPRAMPRQVISASAGLDEERARAWSIVREVRQDLCAIRDDDADGLTKAIAIIKAIQPG